MKALLRPIGAVATLLLMSQALRAGDILRKGTGSNSAANASAASSATAGGSTTAPGILAQQDLLRRTSSALAAVQAMQAAAHAAASAASAATNLGSYVNPANPAQTVPLLNVPDGMVYGDGKTTTGGLVPDSGLAGNGVANPVTTWVGANTPTQTASTTAGGPSQITVAVEQTGATAVLNWQSFNIGKNTTLAINQSAGGSNVGQWVAFNQVGITGAPSQILGSIQAQGQVYVVNPNGIIFGGSSQVNTQALVASSLPINGNLISRGLLNNPDSQFLFSALPVAAGLVTPAFTPVVSDPAIPASALTTGTVYSPALAVAAGTSPTVTVASGPSAGTALVAGQDYQLNTSASGAVTLTFLKTPAGPVAIAYTPAAGQNGNVLVQPGAVIATPLNADQVGGLVALIGPNVTNQGSISTPDGQTILAAGLQVAFDAHPSDDPSLRGLDVYVGAVNPSNPAGAAPSGAGVATNDLFLASDGTQDMGLIDVPQGEVTITGATVNQFGFINSVTSVAYNGRVDLLADYASVGNSLAVNSPGGSPDTTPLFQPTLTGAVYLGAYSVTQILPELSSTDTVVGNQLALPSLIDIRGLSIHLASAVTAAGAVVPDSGAVILAPNANEALNSSSGPISESNTRTYLTSGVTLAAGDWLLLNEGATDQSATFVNDHGQIYLDSGAAIDVSGSENIGASVAEDIVAVQLRGPQLANSPVQQNGALRGQTIDVDIRQYGTYNGQAWVGTPLADTSGYVGLVERSVGELTTQGGTVSLSAGDSVVLAPGSAINVSGGWIDYQGGQVQTSNVISGGQIYPIADASPNLVYSGIYTGMTTTTDAKWGVTQSAANPMASATYDPGFLQGGSAGSLSIVAPAMVLQGSLYGNTVDGAFQRTPASQVAATFATDPSVIPTMQSILAVPTAGGLSLSFQGGQITGGEFIADSPTPPNIVFKETQSAAALAPFNSADLQIPGPAGSLGAEIDLSPDLINVDGFGNLSIDVAGGSPGVGIAPPGGDITIPAGTSLNAPPGGEITLVGANVTIDGSVSAPGGSLTFLALNASNASPATSTPAVDPTRGTVVVGPEAMIDVAGLTVSDSPLNSEAGTLPLITTGGSIVIKGFNADLASGSTINASGGVWVSSAGAVTFGTGGSITIDGGSDPEIPSLIGGTLGLSQGTVNLIGYAGPGVRGATLTIQAPLIQVGGNLLENGDSPNSGDTVWINQTGSTGSLLQPDFFSQGGFSHFTLEGLGEPVVDASGNSTPNDFLPAVTIASGTVNPVTGALLVPTVIQPVAESWQAIPPSAAGNPTLKVSTTLLPAGQRESVGIAFNAEGVASQFNDNGGNNLVRGDLVMGAGSVIQTDPLPYEGVSLSGNTVTVLGSIIAPGGNISIKGSNNSDLLFSSQTQPQALPTVDLGPTSDLDASGATVITPNSFGFLTGSVLPGGSISVAGNIVAESGSRLDVSGWSDAKDSAGLLYFPSTSVAGATSVAGNPVSTLYAPAVVDSNGGTITLAGGQELYTDATLVGAAGGPSAQGGTLVVTSGRYIPPSENAASISPLSIDLVVSQNGPTLPPSFTLSGQAVIGSPVDPGNVDSNGNAIAETGHFAASSLGTTSVLNLDSTTTVVQGGFDWITLGNSTGALEFSGSVSISANRSLTIGANGVISILPTAANPNPTVNLQAPEVEIGAAFPFPTVPWTSSIAGISPLYGPGTLNVTASDLIDVGDLSLQQAGTASFNAGSGSIRGDGTFDMVGVLNLTATQVYPTTAGRFTVVAYDYPGAQGITEPGTISIFSSDNGPPPQVPLSAGGQLDIYASDIVQGGVLRAPIGIINLGWNGDGGGTPDAAHIDQNTGQPVPTTQNLTLSAGSVASVSAADPTITEIPYGINENGTAWIDPTGTDITLSGVPGKTITLSGAQIVDQPGSSVNLSGGGDLYAYEWISGNGGTNDVLSPTYAPNPSSPSLVSFAVVAGYQPNYSPYAPYAVNTTGLGSDPGYVANVNGNIKVGDQVYLGAGDGLPAGVYTVLPARYALLPGGYLVTPMSGVPPAGAAAQTDGSSVVAGYRFNDLSPLAQGAQPLLTSFDVALGTAASSATSAPASVVRDESQYADFYASTFLSQSALANGAAVPQLPPDAGQLVLAATSTLTLQGMVNAQAASDGNGGLIDISSPLGISIGQAGQSGNLVLNPTELDNFGAASLLIGGVRVTTPDGVQVTVTTPSITVDNAGSPLTGSDIILAANNSIILAAGADIEQVGTLSGSAETLLFGQVNASGQTEVSGNGVVLRVSSDASAEISRVGVDQSTTPLLAVGPNARVLGANVTLDSTSATTLDPSASLGGAGSTVNLDSGQVSIQLSGAGPLRDQANGAPTTGLVLSGGALQSLGKSAAALSLLSYTSIDIYGSGTIGSASFSSIALHAPEIYGDGGNATFAAANILLDNSADQPAPDASTLASGASLSGALTFNAATIRLGANALAIDQYGTVNLNATTGLILQASGGLATEENLAINAPVVTVPSSSSNAGTSAASTTISQTIAAGGGLSVTAPSGATSPAASGQLGASLNLSGLSVSVDSQISLPSGSIALHATGASGDVTVGSAGTLDVGGTSEVFGSATQYTSGGQISLTSDAGNVAIATGAQLDLAAQAGGGNGGSLSVTAPNGSPLVAPGTASGQGGLGGSGGSFSLDVSTVPGAVAGTSSLGALGQILAAGGFTESVSVRVRNGPVAVDGTIQAHDVAISADGGSIEVTGNGLIDASGATGGTIDLSAGGSITLDSGSILTVKGQNFDSAGHGGSVFLEAGAENPANPIYYALGAGPQLNILSGSTIDLSVVNNLPLLLNFGGSSITVAAQTPVAFPSGTPGNDEVTFGSNGTLTAANGTTTAFSAGTTTAMAPGSTVELASQGTVAFASGGTGGSIPLSVRAGAPTAQSNVANLTPYDFTGTLTLITPQALDVATGTMPVGVQIGAIDGTLVAPSSIVVEGNFVFTPVAGVIDTVESALAANGQAFASPANTSAIVAALTANWGGGANQVNAVLSTAPDVLIHVQPAAEIVNTTAPSALLLTAGTNPTSLAPGASQTLNAGTTLAAANGSNLISGTGLTLNVSGGSSGALQITDGGSVVFPIGTPAGDSVQFTSSAPITGTITVGATTTPFTVASGTPYSTTLAAGSVVTLSGTGTVAFAAGSTAIPLYLANGVYVTAGAGTTTVTNTSGALTLANTWDFSGLRFGPNALSTNPIGAGEPGNLLLRAAGNVDFLYNYNATTKTAISIASLTDGFDPTSSLLDSVAAGSTTSPNASAEWTAPLLTAGSSSWSFEIVSGADLSAAAELEVEPFTGPGSLPSGAGSVLVGLGAPALPTSTGTAVKSETIIPNYYQTIRTGTGDISIFSSRDILLLNSLATIYTAGTQAPAMAGFETPLAAGLGGVASGAPATQPPYYPAQYSFDGGDVTLAAQNDIAHEIQTATGLAADSSEEMPTNWLYRRGSLGAGGVFGTVSLSGEPPTVESTSWWIDFSNFFEGVGALGGGNVSLSAGHDISNVDGLVPTEARMTGTDASGNALAPGAATLLELGGGDLTVTAGDDINGGVYYVERGQGVLSAGNQILTNSTRTALEPEDLQNEDSVSGGPDPTTELPTTLFLGQGSFAVAAGGNLDLGAVANPFLLPQGTNNAYYNKSYFSTYALDDIVTVSSLAGSVTLDDDPVNAVGSLVGWYSNVLNKSNPTSSVAQSQPWLGLVETLPSDFSSNFALMPASLYATTFSGSINVVGQLTLAPAPTGTIDLLAAGSINGTQINSLVEATGAFNSSTNPYVWDSSVIDLSDANLALVPGSAAPLGLSSLGKGAEPTQGSVLSGIDEIFDASGATLGSNVVLQTKEALHGSLPNSGTASAVPLHYGDPDPIILSASQGDISGLTVYSAKAAQVVAGTDITDIGLYIQNVNASEVTVVSAGRDIIAYDPNSPLRLEAQAPGNELDYSVGDPLVPASSTPTSGDIQIGGPGTLEVLAGRNLDLGSGSPTSTDGLAVGITSIGNTLNPLLPFAGANIVSGAGIGSAAELSDSQLDFTAFISQFLNPATAAAEAEVTLPELGQLMGLANDTDSQVWAAFENLSTEQQDLLALDSFYLVLRDAGRNRNHPQSPDYGNYNSGYAAIAALFPGKTWTGDIALSTREIETMNGGDIGLFAPGGGVTVGLSTDLQTPDQGILTERGGDISLFAQDSVSLGTSRIFTLQGGNEIIWSTVGNIAAGSGSKTVYSAPPTRVLIDPQSADVENDPAGLATGSGIGVLATLTNAPLGSVDLIAPSGTVDAGDAGIRASGSINIAAAHVLNANNIQAGGTATGVPVTAVPNIGGLAAASGSAAAAASATAAVANQQSEAQTQQALIPSIISVEVLGYGGGDDLSYVPGANPGRPL